MRFYSFSQTATGLPVNGSNFILKTNPGGHLISLNEKVAKSSLSSTGVLSKVSFTEFVSPLGNLYSKIQSPNEYIFGFLKDANPIPLFSFYDFETNNQLPVAQTLTPIHIIVPRDKSTDPKLLEKFYKDFGFVNTSDFEMMR
jgi:hypothetical protein